MREHWGECRRNGSTVWIDLVSRLSLNLKLNKTTISFYIKYCPISQTNSISVAAPVIDVPRESNVPKKENNFLRPSRSTAGSRRSDDESCVQLGGDDFLYRLVMEENYDPLIKSNITKLDKALLDINRLRKETMPKKMHLPSRKNQIRLFLWRNRPGCQSHIPPL